MNGLAERLARLTPKQRALLELRLGRAAPVAGEIEAQPLGDGVFPMSFSQQRLWFVELLDGAESVAYHIPHAVRLHGRIEAAVLRRSLGVVVARHEALRTTFADRGGTPMQIVGSPIAAELPLFDLSALPVAARDGEARRLASAESARPLPLARGPLFRASLFRLAAREHVLALVCHHIVADAWSMVILLRDLTLTYQALLHDRPSPLPPLPCQFRDFAIWQRRILSGAALAGELSHWRGNLQGASSFVDLPTDRPRPPVQGFRADVVKFALAPEITARLARIAQETESTLFMVFLAAYSALVRTYAAGDDLVVSAPVSFRDLRGCESLIGFFVNTLLLRVDLRGDLEFVELVRRCRTVVLEAYEHQHLPLDLAIREAAPPRSRSHSPFLQLSLNYVHRDLAGGARADLDTEVATELRVEEFDLAFANAPTELGLVLFQGDGPIGGLLNYRIELLDRETAASIVDNLVSLLDDVGRRPDLRLDELRASREERDLRRRRDKGAELGQTLAASFKDRRRKREATEERAVRSAIESEMSER